VSTEEIGTLQEIVAEGVAREGLDDVVLPAGEAAAKRLADFVSEPDPDTKRTRHGKLLISAAS
jgi:hypothetical protein